MKTNLMLVGSALFCLSVLLAKRESNNASGLIVARLLEEFSIDAIKAGLFA